MDNKKLASEVARWLRVSALTASTLGPVVGTLLTRLRAQQAVLERDTPVLVDRSRLVATDAAEEEKPSLSASLLTLKDRAYNQDLIRRAEELTEELRVRTLKLSQQLTERGSDFTQELGKRGNELSHELTKRSNELSHELGKRGNELSHELTKRSNELSHELTKRSNELTKRGQKVSKQLTRQTRQVSRNLSERDSAFWIVSGFSVGLMAASLAAFILIRKRLQGQQQEENEHILLSHNGHIGLQNDAVTSVPKVDSVQPVDRVSTAPAATVTPVASATTVEKQEAKVEHVTPADAAFLGIANTKLYYPVKTPLDQLSAKSDQPLDIVYFASEEEAKAQGFTPAESL